MENNNENKQVWEDDFNLLEGVEDYFEEKFSTDEPEKPEEVSENNEEDSQENDNEEEDNPQGLENQDEEESDEEQEDSDEDEEQDKREEPDSDEESDEDAEEASPLTPYAKYLKEEGILPNLNLEEFDGNVETLKEGMASEIQNGISEYIGSLPERVKGIINNYQEGLPLDKVLEFDNKNLEYTSIDEEQLKDESTQKKLLTDYYKKTTKFSDERIDKEIKRLDDLQELEEESKYVLEELKGLQKEEEQLAKEVAKQQQIEAEKSRAEQVNQLKETIEKTDEIVPGVKVNKLVKDKLFKNLTTPIGYDQYGNAINKLGAYRAKNPVQAELMFNYIFEATKEFTDWSALSKSGKKSAIKELEKAAGQLDKNGRGNRSTKNKNTSTPSKGLIDAINSQLE